jgi:hypothetical protein
MNAHEEQKRNLLTKIKEIKNNHLLIPTESEATIFRNKEQNLLLSSQIKD